MRSEPLASTDFGNAVASMTGGKASAHDGRFHYIANGQTAFEPKRTSTSEQQSSPQNLVIWIGGLYDTTGYVSYPFHLAQNLPSDWSLALVSLSSAGHSFGTTTLDGDVAELEKAVKYFRPTRPGKIVFMGHSTGCQDSLHYLCSPPTITDDTSSGTSHPRPPVDGVILQAPVSDREAVVSFADKDVLSKANALAQQWMSEGKGDDCLPTSLIGSILPRVGVTARRWLSLVSPDGKGQDDYFSSDLPDERLRHSFGKVPKGTHLLFVSGEADESVPKSINVPAMLLRWKGFAEQAGARVHPESTKQLPGATHNLNESPPEAVDALCKRVLAFIGSIS